MAQMVFHIEHRNDDADKRLGHIVERLGVGDAVWMRMRRELNVPCLQQKVGQPVPVRRQQTADKVEVAAAQGKLRLACGQAAGKEVPEYFLARGIGLPLEGMENHADFAGCSL